ncbi:Uncharacterized protein OBRU01_16791, partial [Operophtera brumata]
MFTQTWIGSWFQSGTLGLIAINSTHIQSKGDCAETDGNDKFLVHDSWFQSGTLGLIAINSTHIQSKGDCAETDGNDKFLVHDRGTGDCTNPPSRAESLEELVCLATWKEGSTRYLVGQISQVQRRNALASDEDTYRCFIYKGQHSDKSMTYNIAQSGDATCNGLSSPTDGSRTMKLTNSESSMTYNIVQCGDATCNGLSSPTDGSRTMKLTNSDDEHNRCHFPGWIVDHHKWFSLDHSHQYHFTTKNATLKFHHRDGNVLELQQGSTLWEVPEDACSEPARNYITLITTALYPNRCPIFGRYSVVNSLADRRRRRQQLTIGTPVMPAGGAVGVATCSRAPWRAPVHTRELYASCTPPALGTVRDTCHDSWWSGGRGYLIASAVARASTHPRAICFVYSTRN